MERPLMPKATAVWLVDNTSLTFLQIAEFCGLHELEIRGIADGEVARGIKGIDPLSTGQITREEIERSSKDTNTRLELTKKEKILTHIKTRRTKYTQLSKRKDKTDAISWLIRNHPEISEAQVCKIIGTTKSTVRSIKERSHWDIMNIRPQDPVALGICSQTDLDAAVLKASRKKAREEKARKKLEESNSQKIQT